jgi:hypothetical protein
LILREHREHEVPAIDWLALGAAIVAEAQAAGSPAPRSSRPAVTTTADSQAPAKEGPS